MRARFLSIALLAMLALPAAAQTSGKPAAKPSEPKAQRSAVTGVNFPDLPFRLNDTGNLYGPFMDGVAKDIGRRCQGLETFGWEFARGDQARLTQIVDATMAAVEKAGYALKQVKAATVTDPNTVVITADKAKKRALLVWAPVSDAVMLLTCDASTAVRKP